MAQQKYPARRSDEYPYQIQEADAPHVAKRVFDQVEDGLRRDGFSQDEIDMLMQINMQDILAEAKLIATQEAHADAQRAAAAKKNRQP